MNTPRRHFLIATASTAWGLPTISRAQAYPARPVRLVVGFPPGGPVDMAARMTAQWLSQRLGQPFIVDNRPGAGGNLGTEAVCRASPDGYTLLMCGPVNTINTTLYDKLTFNFANDIAPVAGVVRVPLVMIVNGASPMTSIEDFIRYARANPGRMNMASSGNGTPQHVAGELFKSMAGVDLTHVPYRGSAPALTDLMAGQVQVMFDAMPSALEHIRSERLRALAVTTQRRSAVLPAAPTVGEILPGYEASSWYGVGAPARTPGAIVMSLNSAVNAALADRAFRDRLVELGGAALGGSSDDFGDLIAAETDKWRGVIQTAHIKID